MSETVVIEELVEEVVPEKVEEPVIEEAILETIIDYGVDVFEDQESIYSDTESESDSESSVNSLDNDVEQLLAEADFLMTKKSCMVDDTFTKADYSKFYTGKEAHFALMAMTDAPKPVSSNSSSSDKYCGKCDRLEGEIKHLKYELDSAKTAIESYRKSEGALNKTLESYKKDVSELTKNLSNKLIAINNYINQTEEKKLKMAKIKCFS